MNATAKFVKRGYRYVLVLFYSGRYSPFGFYFIYKHATCSFIIKRERGRPHKHTSEYKKSTYGNEPNRTKENMQGEKQARTKRYEKVRWGTPEYRVQRSNIAYYPAPFGRLHSSLSRLSARMTQTVAQIDRKRSQARAAARSLGRKRSNEPNSSLCFWL